MTVVVTTLTGWLVAITKALPSNDTVARLGRRIFTKIHVFTMFSSLFFAWSIYDVSQNVHESGPLTRFDVLRLIVATIALFLWFQSLVLGIAVAVIEYRHRKD